MDLVGRLLTIGNFVSTSAFGAVFSATTNTYSPFLLVGEVGQDPSEDEIIRGKDYQEVLTNFPFGTQVLTGLFLHFTLSGPDGPDEDQERTLFDRIGFATRQNGGAPPCRSTPPVHPQSARSTSGRSASWRPARAP